MTLATIPALPPTEAGIIEKLTAAQEKLRRNEQAPVHTEHVIHGGMYARTITLPPGGWVLGALVKVPTLVITVGRAKVLIGEQWQEVKGYQVLPASAGRKQLFYALEPFIVTMIFPTSAKTVEEAEREFTDEHELLLSRAQDLNAVTITGE